MSENTLTTLDQWLQWIESSHPVDKIELGLDRLRQVYERMALDLDHSVKVIVGGTNGKGSTIAMLDQILRDQGKTVGCFTSPHFIRYNERIKLAGKPVADELIVRAFNAIEQAREETPLTYFEYNTLAALHIFAMERPDVALLEVGLGGRLDAINIIDADISVVTTVSVDHVDWLGDDREKIGYEKAGIYRSGKPAICGDPLPPATLQQYVEEIGATGFQRGVDFDLQERKDCWDWQGASTTGEQQVIKDLPDIVLPRANAATAIQALTVMQMLPEPDQLKQSLLSASLTGRMQQVSWQGAQVILDVAHNPEAAEYLAKRLADQPVSGRNLIVLGMLSDKDIVQVLSHLKPVADHWYLVTLQGPRGQADEQLAEILQRQSVRLESQSRCGTVQEALKQVAADLLPGDRVIIAGSFFTVADALKVFDLDG